MKGLLFCIVGLVLLSIYPNVTAVDVNESVKLAITMICRNEEVNFRANLAKWTSFVDFYVFVMDTRTSDNSREVIAEILSTAGKQYQIVDNDFDGFGSARTLSLSSVWEFFPQATHVLIADPDWTPDVSTVRKADLDLDHDVFRFEIYDRNGITTRRMDWLLRNREGLKMRYHLHEVLDIGTYDAIKSINWVFHEIERPGTWHADVGHGHSMSLNRYIFDESMLQKDLIQYGKDPHTHYYMSITKEALANEKLKAANGVLTQDIRDDFEASNYYCKLRLTENYEDEFTEERWACMYSMGITYAFRLKDMVNGVYWLEMCKDYNPHQVECAVLLTKLHLINQRVPAAVKEVEEIVRTAPKHREMINQHSQWHCEVPALVGEVYSNKAASGVPLSVDEVKYLFLMRHIATPERCSSSLYKFQLSNDMLNFAQKIISQGEGSRFRYSASVTNMCADDGLQNYLINNKIVLHPCVDLPVPSTVQEDYCKMFVADSAPPVEAYQVSQHGKFIGAATVADIIHHAYNGNASKVFYSGGEAGYRMLFGEFFNSDMVYSVLGTFARLNFKDFEIVVVGENAQGIQDVIHHCLSRLNIEWANVRYEAMSLDSYLLQDKSTTGVFNFIEYNGGISKSLDHREDLRRLREVLDPQGIIGITYFTKNIHTQSLKAMYESRNHSILPPFSIEFSRTVKSYLALHDLALMSTDNELIEFLGGEDPTRWYFDIDRSAPGGGLKLPSRRKWQARSREEVSSLVRDLGYTIRSWVPTAMSHPYGKYQSSCQLWLTRLTYKSIL